ncbi:MAG: hypothetical protein ABS942_08620 [Solibacillus sp.]|uniref:hypothetical protein n=1 Tax=Solibacillus sp. TaxID=1909654 RepID=UPI0033164B91
MTTQLEPLKESYYEYIEKIPSGVQTIISLLQQQQYDQAFPSLANLAEGIEALSIIEQTFIQDGYQSTSRLQESIVIIQEVAQILQNQCYDQLEGQIKGLLAIFESATEWTFVK